MEGLLDLAVESAVESIHEGGLQKNALDRAIPSTFAKFRRYLWMNESFVVEGGL